MNGAKPPIQQQGSVLVTVLMSLLLLGLGTEMALHNSLLAQQVAYALQTRTALRMAADLALIRQRDAGLEIAEAQTLAFDISQQGAPTYQALLSAPRCIRADVLPVSAEVIRYAALWRQEVTVTASDSTLTLEAWARQVISEATYQQVCPQFRRESVLPM